MDVGPPLKLVHITTSTPPGNVGGIYEKEIVDSGAATVRKYYPGGAMRENEDLYFTLSDHLGSTSIIADENGAFVNEVRYEPFGGTRYTSGAIPTDYLYTGQREHTEIGLYFYNARWYDPALGHFVQADTVVPAMYNPMALIDIAMYLIIPYDI